MDNNKPPLKQLSPQEWELLIEDFQSGNISRQKKWLSQYSSLLELSLSMILRKDFTHKLHIIVFLEEFIETLIPESTEIESGVARIVETLRTLVQAPVDGVSVTYALKEQMMISTTSIVITIDGLKYAIRQFESLVELLLTVMNRPNHGMDRQTRGVSCECLRELERAYPCLLGEIAGHLWSLCQSERTHASQSYILLLTLVIHDLVMSRTNGSILATSVPLVPFNVPHSVISGSCLNDGDTGALLSSSKELRRVMSFLLERPQILTPSGTMEFMSMLIPIAEAIELQPTLLKVQFSGLLYSYDPMLCHVVLMLYSRFLDAFDGQEGEIARRLMLISKEVQQPLVFRLLVLHWLMGFNNMCISKREADKKNAVICMRSSLYPTIFDPLALKSMKLDLLAYCGICVNNLKMEDSEISVVKLFKDGLVSVSAFKWLPPWSTETAVAFRMFHKFLIGDSSHFPSNDSNIDVLMSSTIFRTVQRMLVDLALEFPRLVPVAVYFIERLLKCSSHRWLGERLLQTFDEQLLPKIVTDDRLASYFPIFDLIAGNETIPPRRLLELLTQFVICLVEKHGPEVGLKSWAQGTKVLGICRKMLMQHHSSRVFLGLSKLLAFTCLYFPDLEIRDNARIYLRMLVCIPGKKLRHILNLEKQLPDISSSPHSSSFNIQTPNPYQYLKKSRNISSYIHLERIIPPLVKQSWSLSISTLGLENNKPSFLESIRDTEPPVDIERDTERITLHPQQEPLRVMDSKISEILTILRRHFSCIPDFRHMSGIKIRLPCTLRFESEPFNHVWAGGELPAIYATVLTFSSLSSYGTIPSYRIAFLLGEPSGQNDSVSLDIVPLGNVNEEQDSENFKAHVIVELEPRAPMPGLIDVAMEANAENGQIIRGHLQSITVGIEDMFLKTAIPSDISEDHVPRYNSDLFDALWEACSNSSKTGRETFLLRGSKGVAAISGTQTVKLLEISASSLISAVERYLAPFIVSVIGGPLVNAVKDGGVIRDIIWKDEMDSAIEGNSANPLLMDTAFGIGPLQLKYIDDENDRENRIDIRKRRMGSLSILIFLPPRFHLLFQMEIHDISTLVRIRTDHWPCLAYIDDYLEALFLT
ncbi:hypothetical protein GIB67_035981 [Kingdonia uniflora]|uniref:Adaptor-related protein complex 5 beta subunit n=1 Tax=Kingdonia uniflora TaxID=39325 RepID=A0A7J7N175_9MAGN|nr:hypothetical protein GIB67_035981 [Kingdonia uniflora]